MAKKRVKKVSASITNRYAGVPGGAYRPGTAPRAKSPVKKSTRSSVNTNPLAPMSLQDLQSQANSLAQAQIQPQLDQLAGLNRIGQAQHDTRLRQIQDWSNWQQGNLDKAFNDTREALNGLIATQGSVDAGNRDALQAALRAGTGSTDQAAAMLGQAPPTDVAPLLGSSADANKSAEMTTNAGAGTLLGFLGAQRALGGVGLQQDVEQERQRFNASNLERLAQHNDLLGQRTGLVQQNMKDLRDFELAKAQFGQQKANDLFQQYLAEQELGLKKKDQTFQQWLAREDLGLKKNDQGFQQGLAIQQLGLEREKFLHDKQIDWENVGINREQVQGQLAQLARDAAESKDKKKREDAQRRGEGMAKAMEWLSSYMTPQKGEAKSTHRNYPFGSAVADNPDTERDETADTYQRLFDDALRGMTQYVSRSDALRILSKSNYADWRSKARKMLTKMKRRGKTPPSKKGQGGRALQSFVK